MSGIAGILNLDGSTIDGRLISKMAEAMKGLGPDGIKIWQDGNIGLIHSHFWTTPEDLGEEQPISDPERRYWLAADARIDNREELLPMLKEKIASDIPSDAEVIIAAYELWGKDCARQLIGDFAFALWDSQEQTLFCARDPSGVRIFHYFKNDKVFIFASTIKAVLSSLYHIPAINKPFIGDLLLSRFDRWVHETAYQDIFRLPPAHFALISVNEFKLKRYWVFGTGPQIHFENDSEYISKFRELLEEAVRARLRSTSTIALSVSGGLDSSSIACIFHDLISRGETSSSGKIYSYVYHHTPTLDEGDFLNAVVEKCEHFAVTRIVSDDLWGLSEFGDDGDYPLDDPDYGSARSLFLSLLRCAQRDECKVLLSGEFGDHLLNSSGSYSPSTLNDTCLLHNPFEILHYIHKSGSIWKFLANYMALYLPAKVKSLLVQLIFKTESTDLAKPQYKMFKYQDEFITAPNLKSNSSKEIYKSLTDGFSSAAKILIDKNARYIGIDFRYPYLDRRLIEFSLSVPAGLLSKNGFSKYILRKAMDGFLPEKVRDRKGKAYLVILNPDSMSENDRMKMAQLIQNSRAVSLGFVDEAKLFSAWSSYKQGKSQCNSNLLLFLCVEAWLRHYEKQEHERYIH